MTVAPGSNRCFHDYSDRRLLVILTTLAITALATPTPSVAQPIDPTIATGTFTGGGITLTADDLRRFATDHAAHRAAVAADSAASTGNSEPANGAGPRGGGTGNVLIVECNGLFGYDTIQGAIDAAVDGDVVVVLPNDCTPQGRWFENIDFLGKAIRVQSANPNDPMIVAATVIDGGANGPVVKFENNESRDAVISGITINNGNGGTTQPITGGGISCTSGSPNIRNCVIRDNFAPLGGGLRNGSGIPLIESCAFIRNTATIGGAINAGSGMTPIIRGCHFIENSAQSYPTIKGSFCQKSQDPLEADCNSIEDCVFEGNIGNQTIWNFPVIERCQFRSNIAEPWCIQGGKRLIDCTFELNQSSIHLAGGTDSAVIRCTFVQNESPTTGTINIAAATVEDCLFDQNSATSGGAIFTAGPSIIKHTMFRGNHANTVGGAIHGNGFTCRDSLFVANRAGISGGAIYSFDSTVKNCTVVGNHAGTFTGGVAGSDISNSILYYNRDQDGDLHQAQTVQGSTAVYTDIQNLQYDFTPGGISNEEAGNFDAPPMFVDPGSWDDGGTPDDYTDDVFTSGDYHLLPNSPCIDVGDPDFTPDEDAVDIDGEPRLMGCRVDLGVDEFAQDEITLGDFDGDGFVNLADVPAFVAVSLDPVGLGVCTADINADGVADGRDVAAFVSELLH